MARRLARRERSPSPQSLHLEARGRALGAGAFSVKKSESLPTFGELAEAWCASRATRSEREFAPRLNAPLTTTPLHKVTPLQIAAHVADWKNRLKPNSAANYRQKLFMICKLSDRLHDTHLAECVPRVPAAQPRTLTATEEEFANLYRAARPWFRAFLLLTRTLGLRMGEARAICPADVQLDGHTIYFRRKMDGASNIPLTQELADLFMKHTDQPHVPLLEAIRGGRKVSKRAIHVEWYRLRKTVRVNPRLTPHDLRRTCCKRVYDKTHDIRICQQLLGHRNMATTLRYVGAVDRDELRRAILENAPTPPVPLDAPEEPKAPTRGTYPRHQTNIHALPLASERPQ